MKYREFCDKLRAFNLYVDWDNLDVTFQIPMPSSWSDRKKNAFANSPHKQRGDIDNFLKAFMDALLPEDSMVHKVTMQKIWGRDGRIIVKCH